MPTHETGISLIQQFLWILQANCSNFFK